jgi:hypothetical protein
MDCNQFIFAILRSFCPRLQSLRKALKRGEYGGEPWLSQPRLADAICPNSRSANSHTGRRLSLPHRKPDR